MPDPGNLDETISGVRDGDLVDLLARVESASGADRELDALITCALDVKPDWCTYDEALVPTPSGLVRPDNRVAGSFDAGRFTASLDAALTLVERMAPDALWRVGSFDGRFSARIAHYGPSGRSTLLVNTYGKTPALALLAALLRALIAQAADTSARNVPAREGSANASPSPPVAMRHGSDANAEPSAPECPFCGDPLKITTPAKMTAWGHCARCKETVAVEL